MVLPKIDMSINPNETQGVRSLCYMSLLRKLNITLLNLRNAYFALSNLRNVHIPCHYLFISHVVCH